MRQINQQTLTVLNDFTPLNPFIFNRNGLVMVVNKDSYEIKQLNTFIDWNDLYTYFTDNPYGRKEIEITGNRHNQNWVFIIGQLVEYENQVGILAYVYNITNEKKNTFHMERAERLRTLMLEITQSIFTADSIEEIFDLSLANSIKALEKSGYGSIMVKRGDYLIPVSYFGFTEEILKFKLPWIDSFLARNTNNKMDRFVRANEELLGAQAIISKQDKKAVSIKSTLTGPIYIEGSLYGVISIDSFEDNAFDDFDVQTMEFIRNNIEVAITNHQLYQEKLILSRFDSLTGLYNRHYFEEQFEINRKRAARYNESFAIVLIDIDNFKPINDQYGHYIGDQVLKYFAKFLVDNQRESDIIARFGGDEFIGILHGSNIQELNKKYFNINEMLYNKQLNIDGTIIPCSFSFGLAHYPSDGTTLDELEKIADFEMYKNKRARKEIR